MNEEKQQFTIRRILVALDGSPHSQAALEASARLAALLDAKLLGVFVEDINLLRLAQLPFAHEVRRHAAPEKLDVRRMQRALRLQAEQALAALTRVAENHALSYSFRVTRGPVSAEVLAAALDADLLALGRVSQPAGRSRGLGSTARTAVARGRSPLLLMRPGVPLDRPVLTIYDGSAESARALAVAAQLAQANGRLQVLIWANTEEAAVSHQETLTRQFQTSELDVAYRRVVEADATTLAYFVRLSGMGLLVLSDAHGQLPAAAVHALLEDLDYPVLLVR